MPHTFLEHSHYPRQRHDHLDVGIGFGGKPAELLHGALLVNLISFLHSDSPFSWKKNFPEAITPRGVRVATFYGLPGNFRKYPQAILVLLSPLFTLNQEICFGIQAILVS